MFDLRAVGIARCISFSDSQLTCPRMMKKVCAISLTLWDLINTDNNLLDWPSNTGFQFQNDFLHSILNISRLMQLFLAGQLWFETNIIYESKQMIEAAQSDWSRKLEIRQGRITKALWLRQIKSWSLGIRDRFHFVLHSSWRCYLCLTEIINW